MKSLIRAIHALIDAILSLNRLMTKGGHAAGQWIAVNLIGGAISVAGSIVANLSVSLLPVFQQIIASLNTSGGPIMKAIEGPAKAFAGAAIVAQQKALTAIGESTPDNAIAGATD